MVKVLKEVAGGKAREECAEFAAYILKVAGVTGNARGFKRVGNVVLKVGLVGVVSVLVG